MRSRCVFCRHEHTIGYSDHLPKVIGGSVMCRTFRRYRLRNALPLLVEFALPLVSELCCPTLVSPSIPCVTLPKVPCSAPCMRSLPCFSTAQHVLVFANWTDSLFFLCRRDDCSSRMFVMIYLCLTNVLFFSNVLLRPHQVYLLFGKTGWLGGKLTTLLREQGKTVHLAASRLENREHVIKWENRSSATWIENQSLSWVREIHGAIVTWSFVMRTQADTFQTIDSNSPKARSYGWGISCDQDR